MSTEQTRELQGRLIAAYLDADAEAIADLLAEDVLHVRPDSGGDSPRRGRSPAAAALAQAPAGLDPDSIEREVTLTIVDGDGALAKIAVSARTADGQAYRNEVVLIATWEDGAVIRLDEVGDTLNDADQGLVAEVPAWP